MIKNLVQLKTVVDGHEGQFLCAPDCPTSAIKEMLFQYQKFVGQIEDAAKAAQEKEALEKKAELNEEVQQQ